MSTAIDIPVANSLLTKLGLWETAGAGATASKGMVLSTGAALAQFDLLVITLQKNGIKIVEHISVNPER